MCRISGAAGDQIGRDRRRRRRKEGKKKKKEERKVVKGECRTVTSSRTTQVTIIERWRLPSVPRERKKKKNKFPVQLYLRYFFPYPGIFY